MVKECKNKPDQDIHLTSIKIRLENRFNAILTKVLKNNHLTLVHPNLSPLEKDRKSEQSGCFNSSYFLWEEFGIRKIAYPSFLSTYRHYLFLKNIIRGDKKMDYLWKRSTQKEVV